MLSSNWPVGKPFKYSWLITEAEETMVDSLLAGVPELYEKAGWENHGEQDIKYLSSYPLLNLFNLSSCSV